MRIPKRVNAVLDWVEQHFVALAAVVALVVVALVALLAPAAVGFPVAGFVLGTAAGGFVVHMRLSRRIARARSDVDNLLRENGALRHRNTVLASGVITRESQETQALVSIPEDDLLLDEMRADPQGTVTLDELLDGDPTSTDELPGEPAGEGPTSALPELPDDDPQRTAVLTPPPEEPTAEDDEDTARTHRPGKPKSAAKKKARKN
ncbi:hypothetical protein [Actinomadura bangladeshensis]|uniref:Uncharacterized protein n=1 Tax=Actinomadura bangladeshensis TaxID=453573 RepID=A0A4R4NDF6_9ACTN|nr:hypothetical protein [Actinomadura bangladeshensis]TDC05493.1 hypothetical protein E1284_35360 [Actinomadura bangladeshensis]